MTTSVNALKTQPHIPERKGEHWPRDILEAYARSPGPYTIENAETLLENEPLELFNGWLVWQEMTDTRERRFAGTIGTMLDLSARKLGFGQVLPDQAECLLRNGDIVKPDVSLVSWERLRTHVQPTGPRERPILRGGPELAVEIRSPSNSRAQDRRKRAEYFANHVQIVWDVDPEEQVIWVYHQEAPSAPQRFTVEDSIDCEPLLPNWRRRVADIFNDEASAEAVAGEVAEAWREEGRIATLREMLPMLVRARFGTEPPPALADRLALCDLPRLEALQAAVETSAGLDEWLSLLP